MRLWMAFAAALCILAACSSSGSKEPKAGMARFVGTWEGSGAGQDVTFVVEGDQKAKLTLRTGSGEPRVLKGTCFPGADTLSFAQNVGDRDKVNAGQYSYLFSTRSDGTLSVAINGASVRLTKK